MKNRTISVICITVASFLVTTGIVYATTRNITSGLGGASGDTFDLDGTLIVDSLKVGGTKGGVTFFNGTILNNTTTGGVDNPVTFGDNVRIDGRVYRGATAGAELTDNKPFIVNDDMEVAGSLTVGSDLAVTGNLTFNGLTPAKKKVYEGTIDLTQNGDVMITENGSTPGCVTTVHWKKIAVPELNLDNMPSIQVFDNSYYSDASNLWPDGVWRVDNSVWKVGAGYVFILYKYSYTNECGMTPNPGYNTRGPYKIVVSY